MECFAEKVNNFYPLTIFANHSISDVWQGFEYASGLLRLFWCNSKRDTPEHLIYAKLIMVFILNIAFSLYSKVQHSSIWKFKKDYRKTINYSIWCFWSFYYFLSSNVPANKCHKQKWCMLFFTRIKLVASVLVCAHQMEKTEKHHNTPWFIKGIWSRLYSSVRSKELWTWTFINTSWTLQYVWRSLVF